MNLCENCVEKCEKQPSLNRLTEKVDKILWMLRSKSRYFVAMFQTELHPISVNRARVGAYDHSFSNSIYGKNFVENGSALPGFWHVQGLLTSTVLY